MPQNRISMGVNFRKVTSVKSPGYGKYYAEVDRQKVLSTDGLINHIAAHNTLVGADAIKAVFVKISECVPELIAQGIPVKIDGLGTFSAGIRNVKGGATEAQMKNEEFIPTSIVDGVKINFCPDNSELAQLTSRKFLTSKVNLESRYIVTGTLKTDDSIRTPLATFRAPAEPEP